MDSYIMIIVFFVCVMVYVWNENKEWRKELKSIDELKSYDAKNTRLLRLLISIAGGIFVCLTFIFAILALALYKEGLLK